jgi:NADPH:quinone reductase-like Zn-dependent oxidoreductase
VVVGLGNVGEPVHAALDNVGGQVLAEVLALLGPGGCVLSVGMASLQPTTIDFEQMRMRSGGSRIEAFAVGSGFGADLPYLVSLLEAGELDPQIGWRGSWDRAGEAADALIGRRVRGKAILEVTP